ncbi:MULTISPECIES: ADP-ribosylglycohydrolase family protein [unclassified Coleofasciculus]|uniref:ADP-ribosylglycohydrolase family protein n=1 Tax=unclassified Coleofasciculus TaxID=2692782 RepID=UPI001881CF5F|nr:MULTISPECIES: ADP-ribosylglycohydrolase family protein [unclassified Coleofasciculus]MBE9125543.1 ADP-ribosylglycohydrolase family protein [Coleofasciculus sp. LEGE 07081]MBE9147822.1 ADP-ribosylglycohydrolase family protein [Coleofasciculus sp. LEGE 07092]
MRYSLLSRFQGALLGSLLGEVLGSSNCHRGVFEQVRLVEIKSAGDNFEEKATHFFPLFSDWSQIATCGIESLVRCGRLDIDDWVLQCGKTQLSLQLLKAVATSSEATVATLPTTLFFHDNPIQLRQKLLQAAGVWQSEAEGLEGVLAVALTVALALTEKLDTTSLIPQILTELGQSPAPLIQQLEQVQTLVEQGAELETTLAQLRREQVHQKKTEMGSDTAIALAFYCFLSTPEDFRLCVTRAAGSGYQPQTTTAVAGTLAGVYNGIAGIPVGWRLAADQIPATVKRLQLANHLFAVWSGVLDTSGTNRCAQAAVAAPGVIQPRL